MRLATLVHASEAVARTTKRNEKIGHLASVLEMLGRETPDVIEAGVAMLAGAVRQGRVGLGYAAIRSASGAPAAEDSTLTVAEVDAAVTRVARISGAGSTRDRAQLLRDLFARATPAEQDFLRRLFVGELRQGALEGVLLDAVARAAHVPADLLRRAAMLSGNLVESARLALERGAPALQSAAARVMQPLQPMLAQSAVDVPSALAQLDDAALEFKLDGARVQIHRVDDEVRVFSRTLNDVTGSVPEVVEAVLALPVRTLILDGEVLALRRDGTPHPFQTTMRRFGRTKDVERLRAELPLTPVLFDCLRAGGTDLIDEVYERRDEVLRDLAPELAVPRIIRPTVDQALAFTKDALARGHEGVVAKSLSAPYAAGRRGAAWLKVKEPRTLDLVVLAAEWGSGRRQGWLSNLHLGARDPDTGGFVMLGKTFKGLTDEMLAWQTTALLALETGRDDHVVFVRPELVVEIAFNEVQVSPTYPGGVALRFARVKRYRSDKVAADADTIAAVRGFAALM